MITPSFALTATERVLPRMALDFTTATLDSRVKFTRAANTATVINSSGFVAAINADLPRFDYNPVTLACKGLLIEEARTNLFLYSAEFDNAYWTKTRSSITANATISPEGSLTGDKLVENLDNGTHIIVRTETTTNTSAKLMEGEFTLDDFLDQLQQLKKMGSLSSMMGMLPGMPKEMKNAQISDDMVKSTEAIIRSMTPEERRKPEIINGSRRQRIATGSGTQIADVNKLVKQFSEMQKMMKRMGGGGKKGGKGGLNPFGGGGMDLAAALGSRPPSR